MTVSKAPIRDAATLSLPTIVLLVILSLVWGATFVFIVMALDGFPPLTLVLLRVAIGALALAPVLWFAGIAVPRDLKAWQPFLVIALFNNVLPFTLFAWSQYHIATSLAGVLNAVTPLFNLVLARLWFSAPIQGNKLVGLVLGLTGVAILIGPDLAGKAGGLQALGIAACLAASLCYSVSAQGMRQFSGENPIKLALMLMVTSAAILLPLSLAIDRPWTFRQPSTMAWAGVLCLAVLSTAIAYVLFFRIVVTAGPNNAQLVTLLIPISAMVLGANVMGETISWRQLAGAAVIISGLIAIDGRLLGNGGAAQDPGRQTKA
jgi:drug/metabolite transporter (DMT)-like permease